MGCRFSLNFYPARQVERLNPVVWIAGGRGIGWDIANIDVGGDCVNDGVFLVKRTFGLCTAIGRSRPTPEILLVGNDQQ